MSWAEAYLGFTHALRAAGLSVSADRSQAFLRAVATLGTEDGPATEPDVRRAGRATLCSDPGDFRIYDQVFDAWFGKAEPEAPGRPPRVTATAMRLPELDASEGEESDRVLGVAASDAELLRHRDVASLDAAERARLAALFGGLKVRPPTRTSYRLKASRRGSVDTHATLRRTLARLGEPADLAWRARTTRPRRVVLLLDVSGSMSDYADSLLRLAHRLTRSSDVEVFSVGTRVTRLTAAMRARDADRAIVAAGEAIPDWSGGTRLGEGVEVFLDRWGQRGLVRGAVVVVFSDGWERGDAALLGEQMQRLHRLAHRVVWGNPHKGLAGYQPVQVGMAAALPYVDHFVAGHSLAAFEELLRVMADA